MPARSGASWLALSALLAAGALTGYAVEPRAWDWQPVLVWREPWRWWTAAFVHLSLGHLAANLVGVAVVGFFGMMAPCNRRDAAAWAAAWPLTHLMLMAQPALAHYAGLSGVLHAGVGVAAFGLVVRGRGHPRLIGAAVLAGACIKVLLERPWAGAVQHWPGWEIPIAPLAHAAGLAAGLACAAVAWATAGLRRPPTIAR